MSFGHIIVRNTILGWIFTTLLSTEQDSYEVPKIFGSDIKFYNRCAKRMLRLFDKSVFDYYNNLPPEIEKQMNQNVTYRDNLTLRNFLKKRIIYQKSKREIFWYLSKQNIYGHSSYQKGEGILVSKSVYEYFNFPTKEEFMVMKYGNDWKKQVKEIDKIRSFKYFKK